MAIGHLPSWTAETVPDSLREIGQSLVDHFEEITWSHIGFKGDDNHGGGYHRSLRWCTNTLGVGSDYSDRIQRDTSQRDTYRNNFIRAIDFSAPNNILLPMCQRLDQAVRSGRLDRDVREWYGNRDGDSKVDGYDNFYNRVSSSDSSHLWHGHISLYTDTVDSPHDELISVLIGEEAMTPEEHNWLQLLVLLTHDGKRLPPENQTVGGVPIAFLPKRFYELENKINANEVGLDEIKATLKTILDKMDSMSNLTPGISLDELVQLVKSSVREELDNTRLST